jgi:hypothetical protein
LRREEVISNDYEKAFIETVKDPEFLADAHKAKLNIEPCTGEELESKVNKLFDNRTWSLVFYFIYHLTP